MKHRKLIVAAALALLLCVPAVAVFNERDLGETLAVLRFELKQEYETMSNTQSRMGTTDRIQHRRMIEMIKKCNELSLMLYSQNQDYTFDMTYALKTVTKEYESFNRQKMPYDDIIQSLDIEIGRYSRLVESLRRLPPQLQDVENLPDSLKYHNDSVSFDAPRLREAMAVVRDFETAPGRNLAPGHEQELAHEHERIFGSEAEREIADEHRTTFILDDQGKIDRDSCLFYATSILKMYSSTKDHIVTDNEHYTNANLRLKESYDYAQERYKVIQKKIFIQGQDDYFSVISRFGQFCTRAFSDARKKYSANLSPDVDGALRQSEWRGPKVVGFIGVMIAWLLFATALSVIGVQIFKRRSKKMQTEEFRLHTPCLTWFCGAVIFAISMMIVSHFISNSYFSLAAGHLLTFAWLLAAILLSLLIRLDGRQVGAGMKMYAPLVVMGLIVIIFRIIFIPNRLANLVLPPLLLVFAVWQLRSCLKHRNYVQDSDVLVGWITFFVILATTVMAWIGYVLLGIEVLIWWLFQVSAIETITAIDELLNRYYREKLKKRLPANHKPGENMEITWFFDLVKRCLVPVLAIMSVPFCIWMAADVFDLTALCKEFYHKTFFDLTSSNGSEILRISMSNVVIIAVMYFIFRYFNYVVRTAYHDYRIKKERRRNGGAYIHANEINFTLANNVISIIIWGIYIISLILILKIPTGAISIVGAGLATGLGLAMKDVLNNFIYGIQLMSGRLRVGDWVECDGVRGKVNAISYQSTQIETLEGAMISYLNTSLFDKNFKNLTRNHAYEFVKIVVGVKYGTDVEKVRLLILEAMKEVETRDRFGRSIVDMSKGVTVVLDELSESSVDIAVKQFVLVAERNNYIARAKEVIYNTLNANGIEIPFPQRDVNLKVTKED